MNYRENLWEEIARNDPPTAKFIRDMNVNFNARMGRYFRWLREPKHVFCSYVRKHPIHAESEV